MWWIKQALIAKLQIQYHDISGELIATVTRFVYEDYVFVYDKADRLFMLRLHDEWIRSVCSTHFSVIWRD